MKKMLIVAATGVIMLAAFFAATQVYKGQQNMEAEAKAKENRAILEREHSPRLGSSDAKVTIVEFFDPACETCKAFHPFVKKLIKENPGKLQLVMRYAPLHQGSDYIVVLLEATREQNKFWETLEAAYSSQGIWASHSNPQPKKLWMQLGNTGLDLTQVEEGMQDKQVIKNINQDIDDLNLLGVRQTPSFFVNGKPLVEFGYEQLQELVESEIRRVY